MSLLEADPSGGVQWGRVGDHYEVTRKPRRLDRMSVAAIPFAAMAAIPQGGAYEPTFTSRPPDAISSGTYFERGDILVAKITPSFENGKQALVRNLPEPYGYATTEVIPLRPREAGHDPRLLFFYLLHPDVRHIVAERMEGSTGRQRVPESVLLDLPMPILDFSEQTAMANALELLQNALTANSRCEAMARDLKRAAMRALFTRGLRGEAVKETEIGPMPESWTPRTILDLCDIRSGATPPKSVTEYWRGDIPWVSGKDLKQSALDDTIDHISSEGADVGSRMAPAGSVLLLVRGMGLAKDLPVAVINRPMAFNQDVKALITQGEYSGSFLRSAIYVCKERLLGRIVSSAHGTMTLNLNDVENFQIPCPSTPAEAEEIVAVLDTIGRKVDLHRRKRVVLDDLFKALLHKLMTGEVLIADLDLSALSRLNSQSEPAHAHSGNIGGISE